MGTRPMSGRAIDRPVRLRAAIAVATSLAFLARLAVAAAADPADALVEQGVNLRVQGKHVEALELFTKAHALSPSARTLAQIGLAEGSLHRWLEAENHLSRALAAHDTPWIENHRNREALEQALSAVRGHIGSVIVIGPAGAEVTVDGKPMGRLPLSAPLRLAEGAVRMEGTAPGRRPAAAPVTVTGGAESTVILELPAIAPALGVTAEPAVLSDPRSTDEPSTGGSRWKTWTAVGLFGASAAALATGIVWLAIDGNPMCAPPAGGTCLWLRDTKAQGWIAVGAGAALGLTGGVLVWQGHQSDAHLQLGLSGLSAAGHF
jgi:hypothetical protein